MFYNTGIATYIWVLTNRKPEHRRGKVQLIDATAWYKPLRKNLGKKNCKLSDDDIARICDTFLAFEENEHSKIFPNEAFGYSKVIVERPLRLRVDLSKSRRSMFRTACDAVNEEALAHLVDRMAVESGEGPYLDYNTFIALVAADSAALKLNSKRFKLLQNTLAERDENAAPLIKKVHKPGKAQVDSLHGLFASEDGKAILEYEPDAELRDTEQIPLLEKGSVEAFFQREVLPHVPDAWIDSGSTKIGYEVSFTRYFYKPQPLRTLEEIRADILALEHETDGLLAEILNLGKST